MASENIRVFAPATVANVASGFDVLGFAIDEPGDEVELRIRGDGEVAVAGISGDDGRLPREADRNTATVAARALLNHLGNPFGVDVIVRKRMPLASGLGSSAASSVAAAVGVNILAGEPLERRDLLPFVMQAEEVACGSAHADNVAPALLGGFVLIRGYEPLDVVELPVPPDLTVAIAHPHTEVKTEDARRILRRSIDLDVAVKQWGNLAGLVASLYEGDFSLLSRCLTDVVAEPVRSLLIPGFQEVKAAAMAAGALGCSISGSGPSVFALFNGLEIAATAASRMRTAFSEAGLECDVYVSAVNRRGPRVLETPVLETPVLE